MEIHIRRNGQGTGPFSLEQVREALARDEIALNDQAWHPGLSSWKPLRAILDASDPKPQSRKAVTQVQARAGDWEVLCPQCVGIIGTPDALFCPNCGGAFELEGGFTTGLKCVRCSHRVTNVRCGTCRSVASGSYIRKTVTAAKPLSNPADEASVAVCPACGCAHTNKIRDTGCANVLWFLVSLPFLLVPWIVYVFVAEYRLPNTKCLGCGHIWNAKVNRK